MTVSKAREWLGKTFDLQSAYRQIPLAQDDNNRCFSVIAVYNPILRAVDFRLQFATPFGAISSVYLFNRAARALWAIGCSLSIVWVNFFDDFPCTEPTATCQSAELTVRAMCTLLGWSLALDGKKNKPFAAKFDMLGIVEIDPIYFHV